MNPDVSSLDSDKRNSTENDLIQYFVLLSNESQHHNQSAIDVISISMDSISKTMDGANLLLSLSFLELADNILTDLHLSQDIHATIIKVYTNAFGIYTNKKTLYMVLKLVFLKHLESMLTSGEEKLIYHVMNLQIRMEKLQKYIHHHFSQMIMK